MEYIKNTFLMLNILKKLKKINLNLKNNKIFIQLFIFYLILQEFVKF